MDDKFFSIVDSENGKVTHTAISLVGLGGYWSALCALTDGCLAPGCDHVDSVPVSRPNLYLPRVCGGYCAWIQSLSTRHRPLADLHLYVDHATSPMDASH